MVGRTAQWILRTILHKKEFHVNDYRSLLREQTYEVQILHEV